MLEDNLPISQALVSLSSSERIKVPFIQLQNIIKDFSSQRLRLQDLITSLQNPSWRSFQGAYTEDFWDCKWQLIPVIGTFHSVSNRQLARWGASAACIDNKLYMYGGRGADSRPRNSVHVQDLDTLVFTPLRSISLPSGREGHSMVAYKSQLFIFGGCEGGKDDDQSFDDLLVVDVDSKSWSRAAVSGRRPKGREGHGAGVIKNIMLVYGGKGQGGLFSDIQACNLNTFEWRELEQLGNPPGPRESMSSTVISDVLYVFGGNVSTNPNVDEYTNDLYTIAVKSNTAVCKKIQTGGPVPPKRLSHTMSSLNNLFLVLCGGESSVEALSDVWVFNVEARIWREILPANKIKGRMTHICHVYKDALIVFGGMSDDKTVLSELAVLAFGKQKKPGNEAARTGAGVVQESSGKISAGQVNRNGVFFSCYNCSHDSMNCDFYERFPEVGTPGLNFYAKVQITPVMIEQLTNMLPDQFAAVLRIGEILGQNNVNISIPGTVHIKDGIFCKYPAPNIKLDFSFLPILEDDRDFELRAMMLEEWKSNPADQVSVLEFYTQTEIAATEMVKSCAGFGNRTIVPSIFKISDRGLVICKSDDYLSVIVLQKGEFWSPLYICVVDSDRNIVFPGKETAHANFSNILSHSHVNDMNDLWNRANGTYVYAYCRDFEVSETDILCQGNSLAALLSHVKPAGYTLMGKQVRFDESDKIQFADTQNYTASRTQSNSFSLLVYCKAKLIYWEYKKSDGRKRQDEEMIEIKVKDRSFVNPTTGLLEFGPKTYQLFSDVLPSLKRGNFENNSAF
jgi:hypothetical protein